MLFLRCGIKRTVFLFLTGLAVCMWAFASCDELGLRVVLASVDERMEHTRAHGLHSVCLQ